MRDYIYGKLNSEEIIKEYGGDKTPTANVNVDNISNIISVDVKKVPGSLIFTRNGQVINSFDGSFSQSVELETDYSGVQTATANTSVDPTNNEIAVDVIKTPGELRIVQNGVYQSFDGSGNSEVQIINPVPDNRLDGTADVTITDNNLGQPTKIHVDVNKLPNNLTINFTDINTQDPSEQYQEYVDPQSITSTYNGSAATSVNISLTNVGHEIFNIKGDINDIVDDINNTIIPNTQRIAAIDNNDGTFTFVNYNNLSTVIQSGFNPDNTSLQLIYRYVLADTYRNVTFYEYDNVTEQYIIADPQPTADTFEPNTYYMYIPYISIKKIFVDDTFNNTGDIIGTESNPLSVKGVKQIVDNITYSYTASQIAQGFADTQNNINTLNSEVQAIQGRGGYLIPSDFDVINPNYYTFEYELVPSSAQYDPLETYYILINDEYVIDPNVDDQNFNDGNHYTYEPITIASLSKMFDTNGQIVPYVQGEGVLIEIDAIEYEQDQQGNIKASPDSILSLLTQYALTQIVSPQNPHPNAIDIFNGTRVTNTTNMHTWILTNTPDTNPKVFEWVDLGQATVSTATNETQGIVKGSVDDLKISINNDGTMSVNNINQHLNDKQDTLTAGDGINITSQTISGVTTTTIKANIDNSLNTTSTNPVQNALISQSINTLIEKTGGTKIGASEVTQGTLEQALSYINLIEGQGGKLTFTNASGESTEVQGGFQPDDDSIKLKTISYQLAHEYNSNETYYERTGTDPNFIYTEITLTQESFIPDTYYIGDDKVLAIKKVYADTSTLTGDGTSDNELSVKAIKQINSNATLTYDDIIGLIPQMIFTPEAEEKIFPQDDQEGV